LGERNTGSVEVIGSIPLGSTNYMSGDDLHRPPTLHSRGFLFILRPKTSNKIPPYPVIIGGAFGGIYEIINKYPLNVPPFMQMVELCH
jgi:hypothetical protein